MEIRQLRYFLAVAEELSFSKAARQLNMSQPPISMQIQKLEDELGVLLFVRGKRNIALTPAGEALVISARKLLENEKRIAEDVKAAAHGDGGRLIVGTTDDYLFDCLPFALAQLHQRHKDLLIETELNLSFDATRAVSQRRTDVAFVCPPVTIPGPPMAFVELPPTPIHILINAEHPLAKRENVSLEEIWREPFIWPQISEQTGFVLELLRVVRRMNGFPKIVHRTTANEVVQQLVRAGIGCAPMSLSSIQRGEGIVDIPIEGAFVKRAAIWWKDTPSDLIEELISLVRDQISKEQSSQLG